MDASPSPPPAESPAAPRSRRGAIPVIDATAAEIVEITNEVRPGRKFKRLQLLLPLFVWSVWLFLGTLWYALHDKFTWALAYYTSVDIGLSITWPEARNTPAAFFSDGSTVFTMTHQTVGVIFDGAIVFIIAQEMIKKKGDWMMQAMHRSNIADGDILNLCARINSFFVLYFRRFKVFIRLFVAIFVGVVWFSNTIPSNTIRGALDYVISAVTGAGYVNLPRDTVWWQFIVAATLTACGRLLMNIAIGMTVSGIIHKSSANETYAKIVEDITPQEIEFMKIFEIEDGDGTIDRNEFVILTVVRIGATPPTLIHQINQRFKELDRNHTGVLRYDDVVFGRKRRSPGAVHEAVGKLTRIISWKSSDRLISVSPHPGTSTPQMRHPTIHEGSVVPTSRSIHDVISTRKSVDTAMQKFLRRLSLSRREVAPAGGSLSVDRATVVIPVQTALDVHSAPRDLSDAGAAIRTSDPSREDDLSSESIYEEVKDVNMIADEEVVLSRSNKLDLQLEDIDEIADLDPSDVEDAPAHTLAVGSEKATGAAEEVEEGEARDSVRPASAASRSSIPADVPQPKGDLPNDSSNSNSSMIRRVTRVFKKGSNKSNILLTALRRKEKLNSNFSSKKDAIIATFRMYISNPYVQAVLVWALLLFVGTVFYYLYMDSMNWARAFHLSVSIGYGMFWSSRADFDPTSKIFSIVFLLIGKIVVGGVMAVFAKYLADSKSWYVEALKKKALEDAAATEGYLDDVLSLLSYYSENLMIFSGFVVWVTFGALYVAFSFSFSFLNSIFFALSALAGAGRVTIPAGAADGHYVAIGLYVCTGIPVMALAMGIIAHFIVVHNESTESLNEKMMARITETELHFMKLFGIEDGSGDIDAHEFVILTLVRIGALEPELIRTISELYDSLSEDNNGNLTYETLQNMSGSGIGGSPLGGHRKRLDSRSSFINKNLGQRKPKLRTPSEDIV